MEEALVSSEVITFSLAFHLPSLGFGSLPSPLLVEGPCSGEAKTQATATQCLHLYLQCPYIHSQTGKVLK